MGKDLQEKRHLLRFIETSKAFDNTSKLKTILFVSEAKPNTYVHFRIEKNLDDKHKFEQLLKLNKIPFSVSKAKGFEEIAEIRENAAVWKLKGIWFGYDLFKNKKEQKRFEKYVSLIKKQNHVAADVLAGSLYGYPRCCVKKFIEEHDPKILPKKYTYYEYYKRLQDSDKNFPFINHTPCSPRCKYSAILNKKYSDSINECSVKFHLAYSKSKTYSVPVIVDIENDGLWKKKNGHYYVLITKKPINGKYCEINWLSKAPFKRGTILDADITLNYDYAVVKIKRKIGHLANFHHERKFTRI
jgi:hypothetical protein